VSDSELRQALLGTWRLVSFQVEVDGTLVKPFGDSPYGYVVYTPTACSRVQLTAHERPVLFMPSSGGPVLLETAEANMPSGFIGYSGTFEVRDGQAIHHREFSIHPNVSDRPEVRSVALDGDRLILHNGACGARLEWQRVH
jgi:hypothetical protein